MQLQHAIHALEDFSARQGVSVSRIPLHSWVAGRVDKRQIVLRSGLSQEQQLLTLVHELTHFLAHPPEAEVNRTVCEYEAEAVEQLIAGQLGLKEFGAQIDLSTVTDDMLACSVTRVRWVARTLLRAVEEPDAAPPGA